jgi:cytosine/adenosine deaminase-related metal-dependent hydrolase
MRTLIQGGWVVGHGSTGHELLRNGVVVFESDRIIHVGYEFDGPVDMRIDASRGLVAPGFIDSHVHSGHRALHRLFSDTGRPELLGQPFLEIALRRPGAGAGDARSALGDPKMQARFTIAELLRNGITSFVEFGSNPGVLQALATEAENLGIRAWLGAGYESYKWVADQKGRRKRQDHDGQGEMDRALAFIDGLAGRASGRLSGLLVPRDTDTCSLALLERTARVAKDRGLLVATHAAYNPWEFHDILAAHGCTPIELLERIGLLNERVLIGHCNFLAGPGRMNYAGGRDLEILAASGATVSHCPINLIRRGRVLDSWQSYRAAGVPIALGTDTYPRDMTLQMRAASYMAKMLSRDYFAAPAEELFVAATIASARALRRSDIGHLSPGAKADIVVIDLSGGGTLRYGPVRDPIRSLVECGIGDDVQTVIVDGRICVDNGKVLGVDLEALRAAAQAEAERQWAGVSDWDPLGRSAEQRNPWSFPPRPH